MRTTAFSILMIIAVVCIHAQNYLIDFTGTGSSTTVDSVKVENLSQCTSLSLSGTYVLNLAKTLGINELSNRFDNSIRIFPNPSSGECSVEFELTLGDEIYLGLYDMSGKEIFHQKEFLPEGNHIFHLDGIQRGAYILAIRTNHYLFQAKLISTEPTTCHPVLKYAKSDQSKGSPASHFSPAALNDNKNGKSIIQMQFNPGDTLKLTGKSGNFRTISMLFPDQSLTVTFYFVSCTDADSNHYAVVQIGSQLWMQENLKTTKYRDGSDIPNVTDSATWGSVTTGAWCNFHNDPAEGAYYGRLYNYYAVADSRNLCPVGWHVASNAEWNIMEKFIDNTVDTTALGGTGILIGRILKEGCNTRWQYYDSTGGWNSAGFTALCSNFRNSSGAWSLAPNNNHDDSFWTATPYNTSMAWGKSFRWCTCDIFNIFNFDRAGSSVRCIKDQ